jgi:carboxymethylenebutenolidase
MDNEIGVVTLHEQFLDISTPSGQMKTFVTRPQDGGPFAPIVIYMDIWGVREELYDIARRVATVGYCCFVPDLYYRQGHVRHAFYDDKNRMITLESLNEARKEEVRAPGRKLSDDMVVEDTAAILGTLVQESSVRPGPIGSIGYCMGGRHVFRVAGAFPDRFKANVCLHGSDLVTERDDSPHLSAAKSLGELYCGYAEHDRFAAKPVITAIAETMRRSRAAYKAVVHIGAHHGYALPDRDVYAKQAANRDWEAIFPMFRQQLHSH